jgi:hypothetical protein
MSFTATEDLKISWIVEMTITMKYIYTPIFTLKIIETDTNQQNNKITKPSITCSIFTI